MGKTGYDGYLYKYVNYQKMSTKYEKSSEKIILISRLKIKAESLGNSLHGKLEDRDLSYIKTVSQNSGHQSPLQLRPGN